MLIAFNILISQSFAFQHRHTISKMQMPNFAKPKQVIAVCVLISSLCTSAAVRAGSDDEYFGDTSTSVGSIDFNIFRSQSSIERQKQEVKEKLRQRNQQLNDKQEMNEFDKLLDLVPSWKYYKLISDEYSKRSTQYSGEANLLAPLL